MGNDVWRYLIQSACRRQGQAEQAAQDIIHLGFEYLQCQTLHSLSGQPVSIADCFHKKKLFLMFKCNFLYFNLCPLPRLLSTGTTGCILSALRSRYYLSTFLPQLSCNCLVTFLNNDFTSTGMFYALQMKIFRNRVLSSQIVSVSKIVRDHSPLDSLLPEASQKHFSLHCSGIFNTHLSRSICSCCPKYMSGIMDLNFIIESI